jgi:nicotinamidase-related amidase
MTDASQRPHSRRALLLIDFQDDFLDANGRMPVCRDHVGPALDAARRALAEAQGAGDVILAIGNEFRPGDHLMNLLRRRASIAGSPGSCWTAALPLGGIPYLAKWAASAFVNPELDPWLRARGVRTLALAGLKAAACISATARDALARGYKVELLGDAIACDSDASRRRALEALRARGARLIVAGHASTS